MKKINLKEGQVYLWPASCRIQVIEKMEKNEVVTRDEDNGFRVYYRPVFRTMIRMGSIELVFETTGRQAHNKETKMSAKKETVAVNEFGVPLYIDKKSKSQLQERVRLLKKVADTHKPIGGKKTLSKKAIERVMMHIRWYSAELRKLAGGSKKKSKKAA